MRDEPDAPTTSSAGNGLSDSRSLNEPTGGTAPDSDRRSRGDLEAGVHILPAFWSKGFAAEALVAVLAWGLRPGPDGGRARTISAGHHPRNAKSRALLLRVGFRFESDRFYAPTGLHHPHYVLAADAFAAAVAAAAARRGLSTAAPTLRSRL